MSQGIDNAVAYMKQADALMKKVVEARSSHVLNTKELCRLFKLVKDRNEHVSELRELMKRATELENESMRLLKKEGLVL